jgi:O-antigen/teichoic acid export membrane protein
MLLPFILPALLGQSYDPAVPAAQLLLLGSAIWLGFFWLRPIYFAQGRIRVWTGISLLIAFLSVLGFFVIAPCWGYLGLSLWTMLLNSGLRHLVGLYLLAQISLEVALL